LNGRTGEERKKNVSSLTSLVSQSLCELNGRKRQNFVNVTFNLAKEDLFAIPCPWLLPLEPLTEEEKSWFVLPLFSSVFLLLLLILQCD